MCDNDRYSRSVWWPKKLEKKVSKKDSDLTFLILLTAVILFVLCFCVLEN